MNNMDRDLETTGRWWELEGLVEPEVLGQFGVSVEDARLAVGKLREMFTRRDRSERDGVCP